MQPIKVTLAPANQTSEPSSWLVSFGSRASEARRNAMCCVCDCESFYCIGAWVAFVSLSSWFMALPLVSYLGVGKGIWWPAVLYGILMLYTFANFAAASCMDPGSLPRADPDEAAMVEAKPHPPVWVSTVLTNASDQSNRLFHICSHQGTQRARRGGAPEVVPQVQHIPGSARLPLLQVRSLHRAPRPPLHLD